MPVPLLRRGLIGELLAELASTGSRFSRVLTQYSLHKHGLRRDIKLDSLGRRYAQMTKRVRKIRIVEWAREMAEHAWADAGQ